MLTLGAATITKVTDLDPFVLPVDLLFPGRSLDDLRGEAKVLAPDHVDFGSASILLGVHSFLLQVGGLNILIDSCVGEHKPRPRRADWNERQDTGYLQRLAQCGLTPEDVDVVMCTHLHADHVGWNTKLENGRWVPVFPNARYVMGRKELEHWQEQERLFPGEHNHGAFADCVLPIVEAGLAEPVEEGFSLAAGMEIVPLHGHSPGQIGLELAHGASERALFCGDAIHSPVQVFRPDWSSRFCFDPAMAVEVRRGLLERSAEEELLLLPGHLRGCCGMHARRTASGYRPDFI